MYSSAKTLETLMVLADKYEQGEITEAVSTNTIVKELGIGAPSSAAWYLKALGFTVEENKQERVGGKKVAFWLPPIGWPAPFLRSRQLRRLGFSMDKIKAILTEPCMMCGEGAEVELNYFLSDGWRNGVLWIICVTCYEEAANSHPPLLARVRRKVKDSPPEAADDSPPEAMGEAGESWGLL